MIKAAPVKERLVQRQESNLLTLGVTNRGALSHRPIYSSAWNLSTSLTNQATSQAKPDTPPATCQQNRENLTYGAGRVTAPLPLDRSPPRAGSHAERLACRRPPRHPHSAAMARPTHRQAHQGFRENSDSRLMRSPSEAPVPRSALSIAFLRFS